MRKSFGGLKGSEMLLALALAVLGIALGSFFDLPLAHYFYFAGNPFGLVFDAIGSLPGYALVGAAGVFLWLALKGSAKKGQEALACAFLILGPLAAGALWGYDVLGDFFSSSLMAMAGGVIIVAAIDAGLYFLVKDADKTSLLKDAFAILLAGMLTIALVFTLKTAITRPRYLFLISNGDAFFVPWYDFSSDLRTSFPDSTLLNSFPSGHAALAGVGLLYPLLAKENRRTKGKESLFFYAALAWLLLTAAARMSDGHHFLSDVSWGALIGGGFSCLSAFLIFGEDKELAKALALNERMVSAEGRVYGWREWRLHKAAARKEVLVPARRFLAARRANNRSPFDREADRPSFKLGKTGPNAKKRI
jgi:membrane-associated phospholipid phosphatase